SLDDQVSQILPMVARELHEGQKGYIVPTKWLGRVLSRAPSHAAAGTYEKGATEGEIGPIPTGDLCDEDANIKDENNNNFIPLKKGLTIGEDFEVFPEEAWNLVVKWYGIKTDHQPIVRYVQDTSPEPDNKNLQYEIYPPVFELRKVRNNSESTNVQARAPKIVSSRREKFQTFLARAKAEAGIPNSTKVQVWRVLEVIQAAESTQVMETKVDGVLTPETSRNPSPVRAEHSLIIDTSSFVALDEGTEREMIDHKDETNNPKYNGSAKMDIVGLTDSQTLILEEQIGGPAGGEFVSETARKSNKSAFQKKVGTGNESGRSSPAPPGPLTRGRTRRDGRTRGTTGLANLGNTCYMNSALQCIRSVEELTMYFLSSKYKEELNSDNPLGHGGAIAKVYAGLLASIYSDDAQSAFSPKNFKHQLGRAQPMFSGYGQQDSQEFLSFLVDGLHEDLNRIHKKPYIENPDSDDNTHKDPEAVKALGEKYRENHKARNDSVAMDLFNGFYKNTMVCPDCDKVSITFDPYSALTLQLPIEKNWSTTINFIPWLGKPIQLDVEIDQSKPVFAIKSFIASRFPGVKPEQLVIAEIYSHKFYKLYDDDKIPINEAGFQQNDVIACYEVNDVPTNYPLPMKRSKSTYGNTDDEGPVPESSSPHADRMIVPILHRARTNWSSNKQWALWPSYVLVTKEEALDYNEVLRKVIARVASMTTKDILNEEDSQSHLFESNNGSDTVLTTEEDASSVTEPRVQANSMSGDESIVDVTMTESADAKAQPASENDVQMQDDKQVPAVLKSGNFIPPELQRLFTMRYVKPGGGIVAIGLNNMDGREYPTIESRIPTQPSRRSSVQSQGSHASHHSRTSESEEPEDRSQASAPMSLEEADESDEERLQPMRGKRRGPITYSRKNQPRHKNQCGANDDANSQTPSEDDDPRLIRLGECIILDWEKEGFDALFGARNENNNMRGMDTWDQMGTFADPELAAIRKKRSARERSGIKLEECFAETSKSEVLSEENAWYCSRCKELRRAKKTLEIWTAPEILVIHLKRFAAGGRSMRDKLNILVDFPIEGLDISDRVGLPEGRELIYDLFAVDNHYGGLGGGHYTAVAKNFYDKQWYDYNDSSVSKRSPKDIVSNSAYLLFYRRRSADPLGPSYLKDVVLRAYARESESEPTSRAGSPSGNGRRLDEHSGSGSSTALVAAGAGVMRGGSASQERNESGDEAGPPAYSE
ncbi:UCH-domain-containing protein, partial [Saccharata proteae CBS 121410]